MRMGKSISLLLLSYFHILLTTVHLQDICAFLNLVHYVLDTDGAIVEEKWGIPPLIFLKRKIYKSFLCGFYVLNDPLKSLSAFLFFLLIYIVLH